MGPFDECIGTRKPIHHQNQFSFFSNILYIIMVSLLCSSHLNQIQLCEHVAKVVNALIELADIIRKHHHYSPFHEALKGSMPPSKPNFRSSLHPLKSKTPKPTNPFEFLGWKSKRSSTDQSKYVNRKTRLINDHISCIL